MRNRNKPDMTLDRYLTRKYREQVKPAKELSKNNKARKRKASNRRRGGRDA